LNGWEESSKQILSSCKSSCLICNTIPPVEPPSLILVEQIKLMIMENVILQVGFTPSWLCRLSQVQKVASTQGMLIWTEYLSRVLYKMSHVTLTYSFFFWIIQAYGFFFINITKIYQVKFKIKLYRSYFDII
jgi:hypothetical protein